MSEALPIRIKDVHYCYDHVPVLKDINLDIEQGFVSIIGPNGSGKTTLMKLSSGLLNLQTGKIEIDGNPIEELSNLQRGRLFTIVQQKQFFPFPFSCLEMVGLGRYPYRKRLNELEPEDYEIIIQAMRETNTLQLKDKLITQVSGGEQQRVILASALAQQPHILFLDESFSAMDISYQVNLVSLLKKLVREQGLTVVSIVHDLNLAYRYSDKVAILHHGELVDFGHPHSVMTEDRISSVFDVKVNLIGRRCFYIDI